MSQKGSLMLRKNNGGNQRSANFPLGFAPENGPHQVSSFLWGTWWGPFSGAKQSGNCQSVEHCKKYVFFRDIDGAQLPHISRHPSTNLTKICHIDQSYAKTGGKPPGKTSELSQDRRQNHQERHQSCPFWDIDGVTSVILPAKVETL